MYNEKRESFVYSVEYGSLMVDVYKFYKCKCFVKVKEHCNRCNCFNN